MPVLGAAGLSLSLASGASAATGWGGGGSADKEHRRDDEITLREEEIRDVSLADIPCLRQRQRRNTSASATTGCGRRLRRRLSLWQPASRRRLRNTNAEQCQSAVSFDQALTQIHARS